MFNTKIDWSNVPDEFVIVDLETMGLDAAKCKIIEIGALKFSKDSYIKNKAVTTFQCFIRQEQKLPKKIVELTGLTDKMLVDGELIKEALSDLFTFIGETTVIAYNAKFDLAFIKAEAKRSDVKLPEYFRIDCALELARKSFPKAPNYRLATFAVLLKVTEIPAHRALNDCIATMQVYIACFQGRIEDQLQQSSSGVPLQSTNNRSIVKIGKSLGRLFAKFFHPR